MLSFLATLLKVSASDKMAADGQSVPLRRYLWDEGHEEESIKCKGEG